MSASSRLAATRQRLIILYDILDTHENALQTRKSGGLRLLFRHGSRPAKLTFFLFGGYRFLSDYMKLSMYKSCLRS